VFRTEQRSAEKIARLVPAASWVPASVDRQPAEAAQPTAMTAAAQGAAAALPSGAGHVIAVQRCREGAHGARQLDGRAMLAATAGRRQALRPAFKPGGAAGWRMGQPLSTVSPWSSFRTPDAIQLFAYLKTGRGHLRPHPDCLRSTRIVGLDLHSMG
jgi:hypothetical protein